MMINDDFISSMQVKEDDNVTVGHVVAAITEGAAAAKAEGAPPKVVPSPPPPPAAAPEAAPTEPTPTPPAMASISTSTPASARQPTIHFPPRRTATGDIISLMPAEQAAAAAKEAAASTKPLRMTETPKVPNFFIRLPPKPTGPPPPPRKEISDWEIEQIMLGGAGS